MSTDNTEATQLIELLKDQIQGCCESIEAGYEITRNADCSTTDAEITVESARDAVKQANAYLEEEEHTQCNMLQ